jgi:hypothetical protein
MMDRPDPLLPRRALPRLVATASFSLAAALGPRAAPAGRGWCRVDPVLRIDGQTCHVAVAAGVANRREARALSTGPIRVAVAVPAGAAAEHVASDAGFGFGYEVTCAERAGLPAGAVEVAVYVPMGGDGGKAVPVRVWFAARGRGAHAEAAGRGGGQRLGDRPGRRRRRPGRDGRGVGPGHGGGAAGPGRAVAAVPTWTPATPTP